MIKFKLDENIPIETSEFLQKEGYGATTVMEEQLSGQEDPIIANHIQSGGMCLITLDLDFSDIRLYPPEKYSGIVILRPHRQDKISIMELLKELLSCIKMGEDIEHRLWIIEPGRVRIHEPD
jgi:predicted nuclease of predicted toxin-antitoxin system